MVTALPGCTLTADSFEPDSVERSQSIGTPAVPSEPSSADPGPSAGGGGPIAVPTGGSSEAATEPVALTPSESAPSTPPEENGQQLGAVGSGAAGGGGVDAIPSDSTAPGDADAGAQPGDVDGVAADAGGGLPDIIVDDCPGEAFAGSCYQFFGELVAWSDAEASCVAWGGHLVSVGSAAEDAFLDTWPGALGVPVGNGSGIWLGGTDAALDGAFVWSDGSALVFNGFAPNQPDDGPGADCIEKRNDAAALWFDQRCTDEHPYVCERPR